MKKFFALLKVSVKSMLLSSSNMGRKNRKKAATGVGVVLLIAGLGLYMSGLYSSMLMQVLAPLQMEVLVFVFMGMGALVGGMLFTAFAAKGVVFGGKDNDLLLSMPVSTTALMASRVTAIYLENLVFSFFILVPAGVVCAVMTQSGAGHHPLFWVRLLLAVLALPLLDTALSVLMGALVAFVSAKLAKGGVIGQNIVMALYLAAVLWFAFNLNGMIEGLAANAAGVKESLSWAAPMLWMADGILGDWTALVLFVLCCAVPFALMVLGLGRVYRKAVTAFAARSARNDYKLSAQSASGQKKALLGMELRRLFGIPMYFWNSCMGLIMLVGMGVAALILRDDLGKMLAMMGGGMPVMPLAALMMGFCLSMVVIAAPSVSLEGKYLWVLREAPVGERALLGLKTGFELMFSAPCTVIAGVCLTIALELSPLEGAVLLLAALLFCAAHAVFGMFIGLAFPKLDAVNETVVVKQSLAVVLGMFVPMAALGLCALLYWLGSMASPVLAMALPLALLAAFTAACGLLLMKKGPGMLRAL